MSDEVWDRASRQSHPALHTHDHQRYTLFGGQAGAVSNHAIAYLGFCIWSLRLPCLRRGRRFSLAYGKNSSVFNNKYFPVDS